MSVGFPIVVAAFLLYGLHRWTVKLWDDILVPISSEFKRLMICTRKQLHRMADSVEALAGDKKPRKPREQ